MPSIPTVSHHVHYMVGYPYFDPPQVRDAVVHSTTKNAMSPNLVLTLGGPEDTTLMEEPYRAAVPYDESGAAGTWHWPPNPK